MRRFLSKIDIHIYLAFYMFWLLMLYFAVNGSPYEILWRKVLFFSVILGTLPLFYEIISSLRRHVFSVDVIAILAIIAALFSGELVAAGIIVLMLSGGEALERFAKEKARSSLERLLAFAPTKATIKKDGAVAIVPVSNVAPGDILVIKRGEVVPVDGIVEEGNSVLDESVVNGESIPRSVSKGDSVMSGTINQGESFILVATKTYNTSVLSGIVRLVEKAEEEKAPTVRMANTYSIYFTLATLFVTSLAYMKDPKLATAVLVVATPCPLILAAPIAFVSGMSRSARRGIIVKHGGVFEYIAKAKAYFFDKTGTLTLGIPRVEKVVSFNDGAQEKDIIQLALTLEQGSSHVFAQGIISHAHREGIKPLSGKKIKETIGQGVSGMIDGKEYFLGNPLYLIENGVDDKREIRHDRSTVYLAEGKKIVGAILFSDGLRKNAGRVLAQLGKIQPKASFVLITGDEKEHAKDIGKRLGFAKIEAECLPEDKLRLIKKYEKQGGVVMVGDGVNDAPSLAGASVGVALGTHGATVATDVADAVIMIDDIERVSELARISKDTVRIAKESMFVGIGLSFVAMGFAYFGHLPPVEGAILQEGIDVLVILNALRAL